MSDAISNALLEHGVLGIVVLVCFWVIYTLYRRAEELHEKRFTDAKAFIEQYRLALEDNTRTLDVMARGVETRRR